MESVIDVLKEIANLKIFRLFHRVNIIICEIHNSANSLGIKAHRSHIEMSLKYYKVSVMYKDTCNKVKDKNRFQFFNRIGINEDDIKNYEMAHRTEHLD